MRVSNSPRTLSALRVAVGLAVVALAVPLASAQPGLRASVVAGGAADASASTLRLRGTVGQAVAGRPSQFDIRIEQGFWPTTRVSSGLILRAEPALPIVVVQGGKFRFGTRFTVPAGGPSSFQYWATSTPPAGTPERAFGPVTVLVTPPTEQVLATVQGIPVGTPPGVHRYTVYAGTYPATVLSSDGFDYTVTFGAVVSSAREGLPAARDTPATSREIAASGSRPAPADADARLTDDAAPVWATSDALAFVGDGRPLLPGTVLDLRADALAPADSLGEPETMALPEEASAVAVVPEASAIVMTDVPEAVALAAPFPNPTREGATFRYGLPAAGAARLTVYDAHGRTVAVLADGEQGAGWHAATIASDRLASGLYLVRLDAGGVVVTHRFTVLR